MHENLVIINKHCEWKWLKCQEDVLIRRRKSSWGSEICQDGWGAHSLKVRSDIGAFSLFCTNISEDPNPVMRLGNRDDDYPDFGKRETLLSDEISASWTRSRFLRQESHEFDFFWWFSDLLKWTHQVAKLLFTVKCFY